MKKHRCKEWNVCICGTLAEEPNENCPIHGQGEYPKHCGICGRFFKRIPLCPNCEPDEFGKGGCVCGGTKLKDDGEYKTDWYGVLHYYKCKCCKERLVSMDGGELEIAANQGR